MKSIIYLWSGIIADVFFTFDILLCLSFVLMETIYTIKHYYRQISNILGIMKLVYYSNILPATWLSSQLRGTKAKL